MLKGCPLSPLLFAIYIAGIERMLRLNQSGGVLLGRTKIFVLAFADDLVLIADRAADLKDMMNAMYRYSERMEMTINAGKSKVMVFNKGSRKSTEKWVIGGNEIEEVDSYVYLGVTFQRNGRFTRHHKATLQKANKRATEVWSLGERLFPNSFTIRQQMFESLVLPIILYAAEVTGFDGVEEYENTKRRYIKWTLGLPNSTRNSIVNCESNSVPIKTTRTMRAVKYENKLLGKSSQMLKSSYQEVKSCNAANQWGVDRERRLNELGWSVGVAQQKFAVNPTFWKEVEQRATDIDGQNSKSSVQRHEWYSAPANGLPKYLLTPGDHKLVARFRCGAETLGIDYWRESKLCRICHQEIESGEHLGKCIKDQQGREFKDLMNENGKGREWMKTVLSMRESV